MSDQPLDDREDAEAEPMDDPAKTKRAKRSPTSRLNPVAAPAQRRMQGALFSFLTIFFAGITATAYRGEAWVIAVAGAALTLWMAGLAIRTFRTAREEIAR